MELSHVIDFWITHKKYPTKAFFNIMMFDGASNAQTGGKKYNQNLTVMPGFQHTFS